MTFLIPYHVMLLMVDHVMGELDFPSSREEILTYVLFPITLITLLFLILESNLIKFVNVFAATKLCGDCLKSSVLF
jgi:hypothetical protein